MIRKIASLKDFGIFKNFQWDASIPEFKQNNLIYGWNYSGKTTLSELFRVLENKENIYHKNARFKIELDTNGDTFTEENFASFPSLIKVFNSKYISEVFTWDSDPKTRDHEFKPINFYLGEQASQIKPKIERINQRVIPAVEGAKANQSQVISAYLEYSKDNGKFSKQASTIRKYLNDQIKSSEFNKSHFIQYADQVLIDLDKYILDEEDEKSSRQKAISQNEHKVDDSFYFLNENLSSLIDEVTSILNDSAIKVEQEFPILDESKLVFDWVQAGLSLHVGHETCHFCKNPLDEKHVDNLNNYFSEKLLEIQNKISLTLKKIADERINVANFPHKNDIAKHVRTAFSVAVEKYKEKHKKYVQQLKTLEKDLARKGESLFSPCEASEIELVSVEEEFDEVLSWIETHNDFVRHFDKNRSEARKIILQHFVASYLKDEGYVEKKLQNEHAKRVSRKCEEKLAILRQESLDLESRLKDW